MAGRLAANGFRPNGRICCDCYLPQYETPSGPVCDNGHGGAQGLPSDGTQAERSIRAVSAYLKLFDVMLTDVPLQDLCEEGRKHLLAGKQEMDTALRRMIEHQRKTR